MEGGTSRKRPFMETELIDSEKGHSQKKVKFPKGKKAKLAPEPLQTPIATCGGNDAGQDSVSDPRIAAKKRAELRGSMTTQIGAEEDDQFADLSRAEVQYEVSETFVENGIQIEPFNLDKEREEGFFDAAGNFVEYVSEKEEKDAWLDSLEFDPQIAEKISKSKSKAEEEEEEEGLSSDRIGQVKRRIADVLEPGETVLQALRRLKGNTKEKMSTETKLVFDQLTEDAMKLMENGDYNVYHETQEVFQREAEGYEILVQARKNGLSSSEMVANSSADATAGPSGLNVSTTENPSPHTGTFDMFGNDDDENVSINTSSNESKVCSTNGHEMSNETSLSNNTQDPGFQAGQTDYVYDESSGYYYSSSLGYYYDPSSGLYCSASTGIWYSYNEEKNTYEVVEQATENAS